MRDDEGTTARRPRPVAEAPIGPYARGTGLSKGWLLELITGSSLDAIGRMPSERLAAEGPALCAAICAALPDDGALTRLEPGGADHELTTRVSWMTGAEDPAALVAAVDALRRVTWRALREELRSPAPELVEALADRLAYVCAVVAAGALRADPRAAAAPDAPRRGPERSEPPELLFPDDLVTLRDRRAAMSVAPLRAWVERRLTAHRQDGRPFALLLVEVDDLERLHAAHEADELAAAIEGLERAATAQLRPGDVLVPEGSGRYWVTLGDSDADAALIVATELANAVANGGTALRGAVLTVSIGIASSPQDGVEVDALLGRAEEGVFRARAAGIPVST